MLLWNLEAGLSDQEEKQSSWGCQGVRLILILYQLIHQSLCEGQRCMTSLTHPHLGSVGSTTVLHYNATPAGGKSRKPEDQLILMYCWNLFNTNSFSWFNLSSFLIYYLAIFWCFDIKFNLSFILVSCLLHSSSLHKLTSSLKGCISVQCCWLSVVSKTAVIWYYCCCQHA